MLESHAPSRHLSDKEVLDGPVLQVPLAGWRAFGRPIAGPCDLAIDAPRGLASWDQLGRDIAIQPTLRFYQRPCPNVPVFFSPAARKISARLRNET